jgi:hypothetical protein
MADRRYRASSSEMDDFDGGVSLARRLTQSTLSKSPESFDYSELDKKYPTRQVRPMTPTYIQRQLDEDLLEQKEQFATQRIREAQASIYESQLNEKIQAAEQIPLARQAFSQLNPQDPKYPQMRDEILMNYPYVEGDTAFMKSIVGRNDRVYENYFKKNLAVKNLTLKDLDDSYKTIQAIEESAANRGGLSPMENDLINMHRTRIKSGLQQQGVSGEDSDIAQARNLISKRPELKDEVNKRLISAGKQPIP